MVADIWDRKYITNITKGTKTTRHHTDTLHRTSNGLESLHHFWIYSLTPYKHLILKHVKLFTECKDQTVYMNTRTWLFPKGRLWTFLTGILLSLESGIVETLRPSKALLKRFGLKCNWPAQRHETLLDDVSLSFSERSSSREPVDGVQHGVDHDSAVISTSNQRSTFSDERQHGRTKVTVQSQSHLCGTEGSLGNERQIQSTKKNTRREKVREQVTLGAAHRVQRCSSSHIRQESYFQHM